MITNFSYLPTMSTPSPERKDSIQPPFKIKGRMLRYEEFIKRLTKFSLTLGVKSSDTAIPFVSVDMGLTANDADLFHKKPSCRQSDSIIVLSSTLRYEPHWGECGGRPLTHEKQSTEDDGTTTEFITSYLDQYLFAQSHIYLNNSRDGTFFITIPKEMVPGHENSNETTLKIVLNKITEPNESGEFEPVRTTDSSLTFSISNTFLQLLNNENFFWQKGHGNAIGHHLVAELFSFEYSQSQIQSQNPFTDTLLPMINTIVTHNTPRLLATEIQLQSDFALFVDALYQKGEKKSDPFFCVAGLDIDMSSFRENDKHYFVPCGAYLLKTQDKRKEKIVLEQDDLFVALMDQDE